MANQSLSIAAAFLVVAAASFLRVAKAGDPDALVDFEVPPSLNRSTITRNFFTFTGLRRLEKLNMTGKPAAVVTKVTSKEFPVLLGQSVSLAVLSFPPAGVNPPHIHPRGGELLMVTEGVIEVGLVDGTNRLFTQTLRAPDLFVFPKGLVHFQVNVDSNCTATAIGMFGSANAGTVQLGPGLFGSGIPTNVLAKAFGTDESVVAKIVAGFK